jgi:hypothetical protein
MSPSSLVLLPPPLGAWLFARRRRPPRRRDTADAAATPAIVPVTLRSWEYWESWRDLGSWRRWGGYFCPSSRCRRHRRSRHPRRRCRRSWPSRAVYPLHRRVRT